MKKNFSLENALEELIRGNKGAFESLFRLYYPRMKRYAAMMLKNKEEAEDLVQDVFFQVWKNRQHIDLQRQFSSFLFTILKNKCINALKRKIILDKISADKVKNDTEELYHISFEDDKDFVSIHERISLELEEILQILPDRCSEACRLKWIEGKKNHEIAQLMEISTTMVDKHLAKGLQTARNRMNPETFFFFLTIVY
jgi:RNA polymerase sigma-70 factor (family 1)